LDLALLKIAATQPSLFNHSTTHTIELDLAAMAAPHPKTGGGTVGIVSIPQVFH
jgi:hypothetical protein